MLTVNTAVLFREAAKLVRAVVADFNRDKDLALMMVVAGRCCCRRTLAITKLDIIYSLPGWSL